MTKAATRWVSLRVLVVVATTLLLAGMVTPAAQAHSGLVQSWPTEGATDRPVRSVKLRFSGPLAPGLAQVAVTGPQGPAVASDPEVTGADVVVALRPLTRAGTYQVTYRVVAADGHAVAGAFSVTVSAASAAAAGSPAAGPAPDPVSSGARRSEERQPDREQPEGVADAVDQADVIAANAARSKPSAAPAGDGLDLAVTGGGAVALSLLVGLHLLVRRRDSGEETP